MTRTQQLTLAGAALLLIGFYLFAPYKPSNAPARPLDAGPFDVDRWVAASLQDMPDSLQDSLRTLEGNPLKTAEMLERHGLALPAAQLRQQIAEKSGSREDWQLAGNSFRGALRGAPTEDLFNHSQGLAIKAYSSAIAADSSYTEARIGLARIHFESDEGIMKGVTILLDVVRQDPDNVEANLLLGQFGIMSGQYAKAIDRLEKIVSSQPDRTDAIFLLAEAYRGAGRMAEAIQMLETCRDRVEEEGFRKEIQAYIDKIQSNL